jgi:hypothetical protein
MGACFLVADYDTAGWSTKALHFYEKVIKVKADVAALHIFFPPTSTMLRWVAWRAVKGAVFGRSSRPLTGLHATT